MIQHMLDTASYARGCQQDCVGGQPCLTPGANQSVNTNTNADTYANTNTHADTNANVNTNTHADTNANANTNTNANSV